jgi:hypothetical protein
MRRLRSPSDNSSPCAAIELDFLLMLEKQVVDRHSPPDRLHFSSTIGAIYVRSAIDFLPVALESEPEINPSVQQFPPKTYFCSTSDEPFEYFVHAYLR